MAAGHLDSGDSVVFTLYFRRRQDSSLLHYLRDQEARPFLIVY